MEHISHGELLAAVVALIIPLAAFHWRVWAKLDKMNKLFNIEHEILIDDFCARKSAELGKPFTRNDLPTRHGNGRLIG